MDLTLWTGALAPAADWLTAMACNRSGHVHVVTHINANNYYWLHKNPAAAARLRGGCTLILDGIGLKIGGVVLGLGCLPDLNGTDLFPLVMQRAARAGIAVFLLGARDQVVEMASRNIESRYPGIRIAGAHGGYFDGEAEAAIVAEVRRSGAQMLIVGRGFLRQEQFALDHAARLGVSVIWNVGGLFDFVSGAASRAPGPLRRARLEWLYRFARAPRRMWHRNVVAAPWFLRQVLLYHARRYVQQPHPRQAEADPDAGMQQS